MKIGQILQKAKAGLDSELVLAFVMDVEKEYLFAHPEEEVLEPDQILFDHYMERVEAGEPVAYIVQEKEFFALNFYVDKRVLIPRPETEQIVGKGVEFLERLDQENGGERRFKVLDVGTGSGAIAVSLARCFADRGLDLLEVIDAVDLSDDALDVAHINAEQLGVEDKIDFFVSDLLEVVDEGDSYDLIVANLPYIGEKDCNFVSDSAEKYEPRMALFAGDDGLDLYRRMFEELKKKKIGFGMILGEFCFGQGELMKGVLEKHFSGRWQVLKDLAGIERVFVIN